jgi:hypothetical protein
MTSSLPHNHPTTRQALASSLLKAGTGRALAARAAAALAQAAALHAAAPGLGLRRILLSHDAPAFCAGAAQALMSSAPASKSEAFLEPALDFAEGLVAGADANTVAPAELSAVLQSRLAPELQRLLHQLMQLAADEDAATAAIAATPRRHGGAASSASSLHGSVLGAGSASVRKGGSSPPAGGGGGYQTISLVASSAGLSITAGSPTLSHRSSFPAAFAGACSSPFAASLLGRADSGSLLLGGSAPAAGATLGALLPGGHSLTSASSMSMMAGGGGGGGDPNVDLAAAPPALRAAQARLDAIMLKLAGAALALCVSAAAERRLGLSGDASADAQPQPRAPHHAVRATPDDAIASLRAAVAAARGDGGAGDAHCLGGRALSLEELDSPRTSNGDGGATTPSAAPPLSRVESLDVALAGLSEPLLRLPSRGSGDAAAAIAEPLPSAASRKLLRALTAALPAVAQAAAAAATATATAGGGPLSAASALDPQYLPRHVPALAALRAGCWSPACASLAGPSEAAAPLKPCAGGCGAARFCSRACASAAYAVHRPECGGGAAL